MINEIDFNLLVNIQDMKAEDDEETLELNEMYLDAKKFILSFHWCAEVEEAYFGFGIGGVIAINLLKIIPKDISVDKFLWVIVGDMLPF